MVTEKEVLDLLDALVKERTLETDVKIREIREENERLQVRGERYIGQINKILKKHQVNIDSIFTVGKEEAKRSMIEVNRVKEKLKKAIKQHQGGSLNLLLSEGLPIRVLLSPYRTVMRGTVANVVDRSSGGPIDVGPLESIGEGWGISARGYPIVYLDRYFVLVPPRGGYYDFVVYQEYFGYCIVKAFDDWTSKFAEVRVEETIRVTQGNRANESNFVHFQRSGDAINIEGTLVQLSTNQHTELLRVGEPAYLLISQRFEAYARGEGSYALLDLAGDSIDDNNYVASPVLTYTYRRPM